MKAIWIGNGRKMVRGMAELKRGDVVIIRLTPAKGSEQGGIRPAVIIQNDIANRFSPTTIIAPITSRRFSKEFPTNVNLSRADSRLDKDSTILLNQITAIDKSRIIRRLSALSADMMKRVNLAIKASLALD